MDLPHSFPNRVTLLDIQYLLFLYFRDASPSYDQVSPNPSEEASKNPGNTSVMKTETKLYAVSCLNSELQKCTKLRIRVHKKKPLYINKKKRKKPIESATFKDIFKCHC